VRRLRVLTWSTHESFNYDLCKTGHAFDFLIPPEQAPWRDGWDATSRPLPPNARLIGHTAAFDMPTLVGRYDVVLCQTMEQFSLVEHLRVPRLLLLHAALRAADGFPSPVAWSRHLQLPSRLAGVPVIAVSGTVERSWGLSCERTAPTPDPADYADYSWEGAEATVLTVGHHMPERARETGWELHRAVVRDDIPHVIVGENPSLPSARPARNWDELRGCFRRFRCYLNTTASGGSLALHEAITAGMPFVHKPPLGMPSNFRDGIDAGVAEDADGLRQRVMMLLQDHDYARHIGAAGRAAFLERYRFDRFLGQWNAALRRAARMPRLDETSRMDVETPGLLNGSIELEQPVIRAEPGQDGWVTLRATNLSLARWSARIEDGMSSVLVSYRIGGTGGVATPLPGSLDPGQSADFEAQYTAPSTPGVYDMRWELIVPGRCWSGEGGGAMAWALMIVT
jgi:hypothetical protein